MVRCVENIVNTDVFVRFHFLKFFRELGDFDMFFDRFLNPFRTLWVTGCSFFCFGAMFKKYHFF